MTLLHPGDPFPVLRVPLHSGGTLSLPGALAGSFGVILFYRGAWSAYCNAQFGRFSEPRRAWPSLVPMWSPSRSTTRRPPPG